MGVNKEGEDFPALEEQLVIIALDIKQGRPPFSREILAKTGDWKYLAWARNKASLALASSPNWYFTRKEALDWSFAGGESPLLPAEVATIIENRFVLPFPKRFVNALVVPYKFTVPGIGELSLGPVTAEMEALGWFEPSIYFALDRTYSQLDIPGKTVGITSGKWRLLHAAHMDSLWQVRKACDYMVVGVDPTEHDRARVVDGFLPDISDKVNFLHALTFPDGRKIDLMFPTHVIDPKVWYQDLYLPMALAYSFGFVERHNIDKALAISSEVDEFLLEQRRANLTNEEIEKLSRLLYFVSEADEFLKYKRVLAARLGINTIEITSQNWKKEVSTSKLVKRFGLGKGTRNEP
jgi:hypothetical protein